MFCRRETIVIAIPDGSVSSLSMDKASSDGRLRESENDDFPAFILDAIIFLINTCTEDLSTRIPEELLERFFPSLKNLFDKLQGSRIPSHCSWDHSFLKSTKNDIALVIFRVSMNQARSLNWEPNDVSSIFGTEAEFVNFVLNYWEEMPFLIRKELKSLENKATIFDSLIHSFDPTTNGTIIDSILQCLVSCPPIASDELDIFSFLNEVKDILGSSITYGQDIRVVKTAILRDVNKESHFFDANMTFDLMDAGANQKFKEAFHYGYTLALRGMEFRSNKIAAVADGLAVLFGQPSVGANVYLTPCGSQGLAKHYDDHCVLVWQLFGEKQWRMSSCAKTLLPRLYEAIGVARGHEQDLSGGMQCLLNEGGILYIPRGFTHKAYMGNDENKSQDEVSTNFSLHLTFGIEVEPPFEWEGFAHIALHCWNEKRKQASNNSTGSRLANQNALFVFVLHVAIKLIADDNPIFRKACMVAAFAGSSNTLLSKHISIFDHIIEEVDTTSSSFEKACNFIKTAIEERRDDSLQWMRWLRHLSQEGEINEKIDFNNPFEALAEIVLLYGNHFTEAREEFSCFKSNFCRDAIFEDACKCFLILLEKYRKVRRQYMNGMLSLHST